VTLNDVFVSCVSQALTTFSAASIMESDSSRSWKHGPRYSFYNRTNHTIVRFCKNNHVLSTYWMGLLYLSSSECKCCSGNH